MWLKNINIVNYYYNWFLFEYVLKCNVFPPCKAACSSSLLLHDPTEIILIWLAAYEAFLIICSVEINMKTYLWGNHDAFFKDRFRFKDKYKILKNIIYLKYKYFVTICTVPFVQFNV